MAPRRTHSETLLVLTLIALGIAMRFLPHPANFTPIAALALFSGVYLRHWYAMVIPLAAMVVSDLFLGMHELVAFTWGCFLVVGAIGWFLRRRKSLRNVLAGSLLGSLLFFLVTNWAVWAFTPLYEKTTAGLAQSYVMAIPFFRNTALGDLFYVGVFFGLTELVRYALRKRVPANVPRTIDRTLE